MSQVGSVRGHSGLEQWSVFDVVSNYSLQQQVKPEGIQKLQSVVA